MATSDPRITKLVVRAYRVPTDRPEADGTFAWDATTMVIVEACAADERGIGYSYTAAAAGSLIREVLEQQVVGCSAFDVSGCWQRMLKSVRNIGRAGLCATAISAVDAALWDLKARLLGVSLVDLLGAVRDSVAIYGSGGFTSYDVATLTEQLAGWVERGIGSVKMKIGQHPDQDAHRVRVARRAIGLTAIYSSMPTAHMT